jgi:hypothetical protein
VEVQHPSRGWGGRAVSLRQWDFVVGLPVARLSAQVQPPGAKRDDTRNHRPALVASGARGLRMTRLSALGPRVATGHPGQLRRHRLQASPPSQSLHPQSQRG